MFEAACRGLAIKIEKTKLHLVLVAKGSVQVLHPIIMGGGGSPGPQVKC